MFRHKDEVNGVNQLISETQNINLVINKTLHNAPHQTQYCHIFL